MQWPQNGAAVVPCFNEAATIRKVVAGVRPLVARIIVVDDGSTDATAARARRAGADVVRHELNQGKGAAVNTGLTAALHAGAEWVVLLDGDGQHKPDDIPKLVDCARRTGALLVVGNRMPDRQAIPWLRRQVNMAMSRALSSRLGRDLPDTQCGFRLLNLAVWRGLAIRCRRFEVESEMLAAFIQVGARVEFVPIQVVGRGPRSRIRPLRDAWRWLSWWSSLPRATALPSANGLSNAFPSRQ